MFFIAMQVHNRLEGRKMTGGNSAVAVDDSGGCPL
jgi:hypothetical protein